MPDTEVARCIVCGKVAMVDFSLPENQAVNIELMPGIVVQEEGQFDEDTALYWPDGMVLTACPIHEPNDGVDAFNKYPPDHWIEGRPHAGN